MVNKHMKIHLMIMEKHNKAILSITHLLECSKYKSLIMLNNGEDVELSFIPDENATL